MTAALKHLSAPGGLTLRSRSFSPKASGGTKELVPSYPILWSVEPS